jgi:hypothetical protein
MSTPNTPRTRQLGKLKRLSESSGIPYTSLRDAGVRGEFPIVRVGRALYAEYRDFDRWIETRKVQG